MDRALFISELNNLINETRRKYPEVRHAAEGALDALKRGGAGPDGGVLMLPITRGCATRNGKVVGICVGALQRLVGMDAVDSTAVPAILQTLDSVLTHGVDIQLKVLQTILSVLTYCTDVHGEVLGDFGGGERLRAGQGALLLCFKLHDVKHPVVNSTAAATLRQAVMLVFERVAEEDATISRITPTNASTTDDGPEQDTPAPQPPLTEVNADNLPPVLQDAFTLLSDLCILARPPVGRATSRGGVGSGGKEPAEVVEEEEPWLLRSLSSSSSGRVTRTFALELVESVVAGFEQCIKAHRELVFLLQHSLTPLLLRTLSEKSSSFQLTLRTIRLVFLLSRDYLDQIPGEDEAEAMLAFLIRVVAGDQEVLASVQPERVSGSCFWYRALALEAVKGLCHDPTYLLHLWQRYDGALNRSNIVTNLVFTLNRVITERPHLLGSNSTIGGLGIASGSSSDAFGTAYPHTARPVQSSLSTTSGARYSASGYLDMGLSAVATAASVGVNTVNAMMGNEDDGRLDASCAVKTQWSVLSILSTVQKNNAETLPLPFMCSLDQYDKTDPPAVPERYIYLLALQILEEIASSFAVVSGSDVTTPRASAYLEREEQVVDLSKDVETSPTIPSTVTEIQKAMMDAAWPALLAALTFLMGVNLSEELSLQLLTAFRELIVASDRVSHFTARNTLLSSLARYAVPAAVVKAMQAYSEGGGGASGTSTTRNSSVLSVDALGLGTLGMTSSANQPPSLSEHNLACLRLLLDVIRGCSPTLNESWHDMLETLQNANYVLGKKTTTGARKASSTVNGTPNMPPSPSRSRMASFQMERVSSTMTEGEVDAIQLDIRDLFESSGRFDDVTFQHFTDALCRLSADMIGINSAYHGSTAVPTGTTPPILDPSSLPPSPRAAPRDLHLHIPMTSTRRRASGLHMSQATRPGEKSFAIAMLDNVASNNMSRLLGPDPDLAWNNIINHLLDVAFCSTAPAIIRNQAAAVLNNILVAAANAISEAEEVNFQQRIEHQLFQALSREVQPVISGVIASIDIDIRVAGLHTLLVVLESCGHALSDVWSTVFNILGSVFNNSAQHTDGESLKSRRQSDLPPLLIQTVSHKSQIQMLRTAFPSVNLICSDFVMTFDASALGCAIDTLERYGRQRLDVNITLSAIGLIWNVSDTVRSSAVDLESAQRETLWLKLLHCLLVLSSDCRNEVRTSALQTLFKCLELHGGKLPESTWTLVLDGVLFPLLHVIKRGPEVDEDEREETEAIPFTTYDANAQWADTAALALNSFANILDGFGDHLTAMITFDTTLKQLADISVEFFGRAGDKSCTATLAMIRKLIGVVREHQQSPDVLWLTIESIRNALVANAQLDRTASEPTYSQNSLSLVIQVAQDMATSFPNADLHHQELLLNIVKEAVTYGRSPTYASDVDAMTPVQNSAMEFVRAGCGEVYSPLTSSILCDLAEYITLAFIGAFEYVDQSLPYTNNKKQVAKQVTFIALSKTAMPLAALIFTKYPKEKAVYNSGAFERVLGALALPIKLRYECPASNKYGEDAPLWQIATDSAIVLLKDTPRIVSSIAKDLSNDKHDALWQQIVEVIRAVLLADCSSLLDMPPAEREKEESLDWPFLQMLETHLLPVLGYREMSDRTLQALAEIVHSATQLWRGMVTCGAGTEEIEALPREKLHYWCFDLLFIVTSRTSVGESFSRSEEANDELSFDVFCGAVDDVPSARRTAGFFLPLLVSRCKAALMGYLDELPLRGAMPFERIREEELVYILQRLLDLQVWEDGLRAVMTADGTHAISPLKQALLQSPRAHLFHLYPILVEIATYNGAGQLPTVWVTKQSGPTGATLDRLQGDPVDSDSARVETRGVPTAVDAIDAVEVDAREVAKACLKMLSRDTGV
ncbi:hypothetical protein QFC21_006697 [Naganishia friedmannii]|uniref:Uncharacterized protein n=1 Tax=Naganishia friedmannii TaxID=89922 RepID=A0ACC2V1V1_9TREE|nr:hypothetical protein QFC21_006697 [Naganishia friedmannii]